MIGRTVPALSTCNTSLERQELQALMADDPQTDYPDHSFPQSLQAYSEIVPRKRPSTKDRDKEVGERKTDIRKIEKRKEQEQKKNMRVKQTRTGCRWW
jgi:hypothetical protein